MSVYITFHYVTYTIYVINSAYVDIDNISRALVPVSCATHQTQLLSFEYKRLFLSPYSGILRHPSNSVTEFRI